MNGAHGLVNEILEYSRVAVDGGAETSTWDAAITRLRTQLLALYPKPGEASDESRRELRAKRPSALELLSQRTQDQLDVVLRARDKVFGRVGVLETLSELEQLPGAAEAGDEIQGLRDRIEGERRLAIDSALAKLTEVGRWIEECLAKC